MWQGKMSFSGGSVEFGGPGEYAGESPRKTRCFALESKRERSIVELKI